MFSAQNNAEDWKLGSRGCYDAASLARLQTNLKLAFPAFASATVAECASQAIGANVGRALADETLSADPDALARLMADHTQVSCPAVPFILINIITIINNLIDLLLPAHRPERYNTSYLKYGLGHNLWLVFWLSWNLWRQVTHL